MLLGQCGQWVLLLPFHLLYCSLGACIYFPPCLRLKENTSPVHRQDTFFWFSLSLAAGGASGKEPTCKCRWCRRHGFDPWVGKVSWWRAWQPTSVFLLGESHGQRSLAGHSPWGCQELKKPEQLNCTISSRTSLERVETSLSPRSIEGWAFPRIWDIPVQRSSLLPSGYYSSYTQHL